jgi:glycosyltransferase involved in cell wall biosynthesis
VNIVGFLNKNDPQDRLRLEKIYRHSDFFLLPTRAECYGIVFCEANAYGLPVLSTATGGIPEIVRNGVNGFLLPLEARGEAYAAHILSIFGNPAKYRKMRAASREQFETRLNWDAWGKRMNEILWSAVDSTQVDSTQIEPAPRSPHPEAELNSVKLGVDAKGQGR